MNGVKRLEINLQITKYSKMKEKYRRALFITVYSIVNKKPVYLILKRKLHWKGWEFPKGGKRFYETENMTVRREIKEETGLKILDIKKFEKKGKYKYDKEYPDRRGIAGQTYKLYAVKVEKRKVRLDKKEHSDYKWVNFSEAIKKLKWKNQKDCLRIVNAWLASN